MLLGFSVCIINVIQNYLWPFGIKLLGFPHNCTFYLAGSNLADIESPSESLFLTSLISSDAWTGGLLEVRDGWDQSLQEIIISLG